MKIAYTSSGSNPNEIIEFLERCKAQCDKLVFGVITDEVVQRKYLTDYDKLEPRNASTFTQRWVAAKNIDFIDEVVEQPHLDLIAICQNVGAKTIIVQEEKYKNNHSHLWEWYREDFQKAHIEIIYQ